MCVIAVVGVAPCQCFSPGAIKTTSPLIVRASPRQHQSRASCANPPGTRTTAGQKRERRLLQVTARKTMSTDFRDRKTFPRRGREALGDFLWLARVFDKTRAKASRTHDGYIYPCPMDRMMIRLWGVGPREFTAAIGEHSTDDQILAWLSERVTPNRMRTGCGGPRNGQQRDAGRERQRPARRSAHTLTVDPKTHAVWIGYGGEQTDFM